MLNRLKITTLCFLLIVLIGLTVYLMFQKAFPEEHEFEEKMPRIKAAQERRAEYFKQLEKERIEQVIASETERYQVEKTEFNSVESFVHETYKNWQTDSEYKKPWAVEDEAELNLIQGSIGYIDYFSESIKQKDMIADFKELQDIALEYERTRGHSVAHADLERAKKYADKFEVKLKEIKEKLQ